MLSYTLAEITNRFLFSNYPQSQIKALNVSTMDGRTIFVNFINEKTNWAKFPHSPILHYACRSLLTENNGKNNAIAMGLCAVFVVSSR